MIKQYWLPPTPMSQHPRFDEELSIRKWINDPAGAPDILYVDVEDMAFRIGVEESYENPFFNKSFTQVRLSRHRARGLAPWTGQPFVYEWHYALDDKGRWIAGPTQVHQIGWW